MKQREARKSVMIKARLRLPAGWRDGCILNLSSRGMMLQCPDPPPRGAYLEIRRGAHVVVARVVWARAHRFGVRSQDPIDMAGLVHEPDRSRPADRGDPPAERRTQSRPLAERHERSRIAGRALEFAGLAAFGLVAATTAVGWVEHLFAAPIQSVERALGGGEG